MNASKPTYQQLEEQIKKLQQENAKLKLNQKIFDASPAYIVLISPNGKVLSMNESLLNTLGYKLDEVLGKDYIGTFIPKQDRPKLVELFTKHATNEELAVHTNSVLKKDGSIVTVQWHGTPFFEKETNLQAYLGIGIDITESIENKNVANINYAQLSAIIQNYPGGSITLIDKNHTVVFTGGNGYLENGLNPSVLLNKHFKKHHKK